MATLYKISIKWQAFGGMKLAIRIILRLNLTSSLASYLFFIQLAPTNAIMTLQCRRLLGV